MKDVFLNKLKAFAASFVSNGEHIYLYGSRARQTANELSDWDILVLTQKEYSNENAFEHYIYPLTKFGQENGENVSVLVYSLRAWEDKKNTTMFYHTVSNDKILLI